jgi:hypothetical protein
MKASKYKKLKGLRKESLRDNMTDIEVALTNIGEIATRDIAREEQPQGLKENLNVYNQFFTFDNTGMTMKAKSLNGQISEFSTKLTNNELGFYQGENKVAYINNNQLNISKAEITNGMTIGGDAPMFQIGNFVIMQESNGSLSIGLKS